MKKVFIIFLSVLSLTAFAQTEQMLHQIAIDLAKVEDMSQINILAKKGEKAQAKALAEEALWQIEKIEADQKRLARMDETLDEKTLMIPETQETKRYLMNRLNQLRYTNIYIICDAKLFDSEYGALLGDIQGALSASDVSFVDSANVSDWSVTITAKAREHTKPDFGGITTYFAYVDAKTVIEKTASGKRLYDNTFTKKGGSPVSFEQAATEAYQHLAPEISAAIKKEIAK